MQLTRAVRLGSLFLGYLVFSVAAGVFLTEITLHPARRSLTVNDTMQAAEMASGRDAALSDVTIQAHDGAALNAWSIRPRNNNSKAVILLHGLSDNRLGMIGYAELLLAHGYNILMPDARAHGASGGQLATYGLLEADDIRRWFDWLRQNQHPDCIFGFGESMGAAQLLQSLQTERNFCAVAAESPFSDFREIAYDRVGQFFHTGPWLGRTILRPMVETAFVYAKWKYKMDFEQVSPESIVAKSKIPVMLIHGQKDSNIPIRHSRQIAARNPALILWEVPQADHCGAISTQPNEFEQKLLRWFNSHSAIEPTAELTRPSKPPYPPAPNRYSPPGL